MHYNVVWFKLLLDFKRNPFSQLWLFNRDSIFYFFSQKRGKLIVKFCFFCRFFETIIFIVHKRSFVIICIVVVLLRLSWNWIGRAYITVFRNMKRNWIYIYFAFIVFKRLRIIWIWQHLYLFNFWRDCCYIFCFLKLLWAKVNFWKRWRFF